MYEAAEHLINMAMPKIHDIAEDGIMTKRDMEELEACYKTVKLAKALLEIDVLMNYEKDNPIKSY